MQHPIFTIYHLDDLELRLGYKIVTLSRMRDGVIPAGKRFRQLAALKLGRIESELFISETEKDDANNEEEVTP